MSLLLYGRCMLSKRPFLPFQRLQHGYVVLIPEIGEDSAENIHLLKNDGLPEFNNITIENCRAAIAKQTLDFEEGIKSLGKQVETRCNDIFKDFFEPLEKLSTPLEMTWGLSKTLYLGNSILMPTSSYMSIHDRASRARASKYTDYAIYNAVNLAIESNRAKTTEENRILRKFHIEGKLNGLELNAKNKQILVEYLDTLSKEKNLYKYKMEMSTKVFSQDVTDAAVIREFPSDLLKAVSADSNNSLLGPWKVTLNPYVYMGVMEYCSDRNLRWNCWLALVTRGSNMRDDDFRASLQVEEIRFARRDIAKILGYDTYAEMSMETKMAGGVQDVQMMLSTLLKRAKYAQEQELRQLYEFAVERGFQHSALQLWDVPYWRRKQRTSVVGYSEEKFREYFPLKVVLNGLFQLCENLFNIQIRQRSNVVAWHKDVKFYDIFETHSSAPVGGFYLDPYARSEQKINNNGWMVAIQNFSRFLDRKPLSALIFNFDPPGENGSSYLTFKEVSSLFNKFGHALQHLLTRTNYSEVAGLSNIEWDVVEMSGHVLEHWVLNKNVIDSISCHRDSQDKLPSHMYQTLLDLHNHMAGLDLSRELYLSALDLELHSTKDFWLDVMKRLWPEYRCFPLDTDDWHVLSFKQIFLEDWAAAYYSHVWSRMIAADVYSAFHEVQGDETQIREVGKRYRDTFLALGGSVHPSQVFREFRGRDPSPKALMSSLGLKKLSDDKD